MANSKLYLGDINIGAFRFGSSDISLYLGDKKVYPLQHLYKVIYNDDSEYEESCNSTGILSLRNIPNFQNVKTLYVGCATKLKQENIATYDGTFSGFTSLENIIFENDNLEYFFRTGTTNVYGSFQFAFSNITTLKKFKFPKRTDTLTNSFDSVRSFYNCSALTEIDMSNLSNSDGDIGQGFAYNCQNLTKIITQYGENTISFKYNQYGDNTISSFYNCSSLPYLKVITTNGQIGADAFRNCTSLQYIMFYETTPPTLTNTNALFSTNNCDILVPCDSVDAYKTAENWSTFASRIKPIEGSCSFTGKFKATYNDGSEPLEIECDSSTELTSGETQPTGYTASAMTTGQIGNCVTSLGNRVFRNCSGLTSIDIPDSVTSIGQYAFRDCASLSSITIPNGVTSISNYTFYNCSDLTSIDIPDSVTSIGQYAFSNCSGLTSIDIPSGVTSISAGAFQYCTSLNSINIPNGVTSISNSTFFNCSGLTSIDIPDSVTSIGQYAFYFCSGLISIDIPSGVTTIGNMAFRDCTSLSSINIPNGVTSISNSTFYGCTSLNSITIPNSVTSIGENAFQDCTGLTSIDIPSGVTSISKWAFYDCNSLTSITVNATTPPALETYAFDYTNNCPIYVPSESLETYKSSWSDYASRIRGITS